MIVGLTYVGIAIGRWPRIKSNRATIALMGTGLLLVTGQVAFKDLPGLLDFDTLILLFSMMIINANLRLAGFFTLAGRTLLRLARSPRMLLGVEIVLVGLLSALFLNDTICLMLTPLMLEIALALEVNPIPYLIALATASNIGSTATLTGNPQNMIIGVASGIPYLQFAGTLLPVALLGMGAIWIVVVLFYPFDFKRGKVLSLPEKELEINRWQITKTLAIVAGLLAAFLVGVPVAEAAFLAACLLLFTRRTQPHLVFAEFDWGLLVFFAGLFIVSGTLERNGITTQLFNLINLTPQANLWVFSGFTVVLSNLVSNVPAVLLLKSVVVGMPNANVGWMTLAVASTLAGNLTLLGSVANLIVAEIALRWRVELRFWEYTRAGLVITLISLVTGLGWMQLFIWR